MKYIVQWEAMNKTTTPPFFSPRVGFASFYAKKERDDKADQLEEELSSCEYSRVIKIDCDEHYF